jgi:hypothetical protein
MTARQIALVSLSKKPTHRELSQTAAALQKQATRDLGPIWGFEAMVNFFPDMKSVPFGYWPIIVMDKLDDPSAAGYHTDKHHQPYALVEYDDDWQLTCSHEMCEMMVDPWGNKLATGGSPKSDQGKVHFLVEVCDPCEDASHAYSINGILMSDFYTPNFFDPQKVHGVRYSYTGSIAEPRQVLKNGYLSWHDPKSGKWFQQTYFGTKSTIKPIAGMMSYGSSLRGQMDRLVKNPNVKKAFAAKSIKHKNIHEGVQDSGAYATEAWKKEISRYVKGGKVEELF